jgi:hypothetical protein
VLKARRVWTVVVGAWVSAWVVTVLARILDLDGTLVLILGLVAALVGGLASVGEARSVEPWTVWDERDAYLGWLTFLGIVAVIACLFIPMPWGLLAAAVVAALTIAVLRRAPPAPAEPEGDAST